jgi:hypothetical protein
MTDVCFDLDITEDDKRQAHVQSPLLVSLFQGRPEQQGPYFTTSVFYKSSMTNATGSWEVLSPRCKTAVLGYFHDHWPPL